MAGPDADRAGEQSTLPDASPASPEQEDATAAGAPRETDDTQARRLLGFGILALTLLLAVLAAWRLPMRRHVEDTGAWGTPATFAHRNGSQNGFDARGEARGPAVAASAQPAPLNGDLRQTKPFTNKPYVDRTAMVLAAGVGRSGTPRRRAFAKNRLSREKRRSAAARGPAGRHFSGGVPRNGGRTGGGPGNGGRR